ncbi:MAG: glycine--tRNA ligase [Candidatus Aenigmarchaeota archaeon]|nr:glycine--tRNA ligase [Candidatus Aenigmarchaeota archaeon]
MAQVEKEKVETLQKIANLCKRRAFVFPSCEIYGGFAGFYDYGPLGSEMKLNLKESWWKRFVRGREDVVGVDACTVNHPQVWTASGHVDGFADPLVDCRKCGYRIRADHLIEDVLGVSADGWTLEQFNEKIRECNLVCPKCKGELSPARKFNLMFKTFVGPIEDDAHIAYLRPETAQMIFTNFKSVVETARVKLPFGIAQMGRAYRNEISPRDFLFRLREFEQMEIEFFVHPKKLDECPYLKGDVLKFEVMIYSAEAQEKEGEPVKMTIGSAVENKVISTGWHAYWLYETLNWFLELGISPEKLRLRQHLSDERAHYAVDCWDIEYKFPFGWKEIHGMSNRTDFDLKQHIKFSGKDLTYFEEETHEKVIPHVIEPSQGLDRAFLSVLIDAYREDGERVYLKLHPTLAPTKIGVFPIVKKDGLAEKGREIYESLKDCFSSMYDDKGSIGKRYARSDEVGIPICIAVDYDTLKDDTVTLRDRDTTKQIRVPIAELKSILWGLLYTGGDFEKAGEIAETRKK